MKKSIAILAGISLLLLPGLMVSADQTETDQTNDVFHWWQTGGTFTWEYATSKPDIDITEVSYVTSGSSITLSLTVDGAIVDDELVTYNVILSKSDGETGSTIGFSYTNGEGTSYYYSMTGGGTGGDPVVSGDTISTTFDTTIDDESGYEVIATTYQYTDFEDITQEYWMDSNQPMATENENTDDTSATDSGNQNTNVPPPPGTPGFEFFALIIASIALMVIFRKGK